MGWGLPTPVRNSVMAGCWDSWLGGREEAGFKFIFLRNMKALKWIKWQKEKREKWKKNHNSSLRFYKQLSLMEVMPGRVNSATAGHQCLVLISLLSSAINWPQLQTVSVTAICFFTRHWSDCGQQRGLGGERQKWQNASAALGRCGGVRVRLVPATIPDSWGELSVKINCEGCFKAAAQEMHFCLQL